MPDPTAITEARGELARLTGALRESGIALEEARRRLDELLGQGAPAAAVATAEGSTAGLRAQRDTLLRDRLAAADRLTAAAERFTTEHGRTEDAVSRLDGGVPVALLPVRIETRYLEDALHVRVFPDQIHVDTHDEALTAQEAAAGRQYWTARWPDLENTDLATSAWQTLCRGRRPGRARYLADVTRPGGSTAENAPSFPRVTERAAQWPEPPTAAALPDRVAVVGYRRTGPASYTEIFRVWGSAMPDRLQVGPSPDVLAGERAVAAGDDGLAWLEHPDRARALGTLVTITQADVLAGHRLSDGVDRLLVLGVDWTRTPEEAVQALDSLLTGHAREGHLSFARQGTTTNSTTATGADTAPGPAAFDPATVPPPLDEWSAARRTTHALGLPDAALSGAPGADLREQRVHAALTDATWRATGGYYLTDMLTPITVEPALDADLRRHVAAHVIAGGPLPTLRVGAQPYGVLPVTSRRFAPATRVERTVKRVADVLRDIVEPQIAAVPRIGRSGQNADVDETLIAILLRTPVPWALRFRQAIGPATLKAMSVYWEHLAAIQRTWTAIIWQRLGVQWATRLSELTLDEDDHALRVPLVTKGEARSTAYLEEIRSLLTHPEGRLALNVRQDSEALLEAMIACAAVQEIDRAGARKGSDAVVAAHPQVAETVTWVKTLHVPTPDLVRVETEPAQPLHFASPRALAEAIVPVLDPTTPVAKLVARDLGAATITELLGLPDDPLHWAARFSHALTELAAAPVNELEWAFRGHLDLFTSRLDAWYTSLASSRLADHRQRRPRGLHLGCWGWVEDLRPDPTGSDSLGYVHAPSLAHAASAALLRSARHAHQNEAGELFDLRITSRRAREAIALLTGVAQGQLLTALLGYRLERGLQDAGPQLARYVWELRTLAPLRSDETPADQPREAIAARDVVDAVTLLERWRSDRPGTLAAAHVAAEHAAPVAAVLDSVAETYDAVSDLLVAEAVHQAAQGNLERAGAALAAQDRAAAAPELDYPATPRPGHTVTQRVGILLQGSGPAPGWPADVRTAVEPRLDRWVGTVLGPADDFEVAARLIRTDGTAVPLTPVGIGTLGLSALSVALAAQAPATEEPSELESRLVLALAEQVTDPSEGDRIELLDDGPVPDHASRGFGLLRALCGWIAGLAGSPALGGEELVATGTPVHGDDGEPAPAATPDLAELRERAAGAVAALDDALDRPTTGLLAAQGTGDPGGLGAALLAAASFDDDAVPHAPASHPDGVTILGAQAQAVRDRLEAARTAAHAALASAPEMDATAETQRLRGIVTTVLGRRQPVLPLLALADPAPPTASAADRAALTAGDPFAVVTWLDRLAQVRSSLDPLAAVLRHAEADGADLAGQLHVLQAPHRPGVPWCALPFGETGPPPAGTAALAFHATEPVDFAQPFAGLVVDAWSETIPEVEETTAVTFHYDAPGARAPQALLLAVHPAESPQQWDFTTLLDTVVEAADLAKLRTLNAPELAPLAGFLPALYLPEDYTRDVPSIGLKELLDKVRPSDINVAHVLGKE